MYVRIKDKLFVQLVSFVIQNQNTIKDLLKLISLLTKTVFLVSDVDFNE